MPLKLTREPAEEDRFEVRFTMRDGETTVECFADEDAIDDLDHNSEGGESLVERFARHRPMFESIASWLFDEGESEPRIELHHVVQFQAL